MSLNPLATGEDGNNAVLPMKVPYLGQRHGPRLQGRGYNWKIYWWQPAFSNCRYHLVDSNSVNPQPDYHSINDLIWSRGNYTPPIIKIVSTGAKPRGIRVDVSATTMCHLIYLKLCNDKIDWRRATPCKTLRQGATVDVWSSLLGSLLTQEARECCWLRLKKPTRFLRAVAIHHLQIPENVKM